MVSRAGAILLVAAVAAGALAASAGSVSCVDQSHELAVQALGAEDPSVPPGPLHRPGQPCITCHGGSGPASTQFSVGGTVYQIQGQNGPAVNAVVQMEDIDGHTFSVTTNEVGNFFVPLSVWAPHYPMLPQVTSADGMANQAMASHVSRDGSCADCHAAPSSRLSPGPVYLYAYTPPDGG